MKKLTESLTQDGMAILDKIVGSISHKYAGEWEIDYEDLYQELMLDFYKKFGSYDDNDIQKNRALVNKSLERSAIDYYRYSRIRYDRKVHELSNLTDDSTEYAGDQLFDSTITAASDFRPERSANIGRNRFRKPDEGVVVQELLTKMIKEFGKYSDEVRYFIGQIALNGLLDTIKPVISRDDYKMASKIYNKNDIGEFIDPDEPLATGNSRYRNAAKNVDTFLRIKRRKLGI